MGDSRLVKGRLQFIQLFQRFTQVHKDDVCFLADNAVYGCAALLAFFDSGPCAQEGLQLVLSLTARILAGKLPCRPVDRAEIMERKPASSVCAASLIEISPFSAGERFHLRPVLDDISSFICDAGNSGRQGHNVNHIVA